MDGETACVALMMVSGYSAAAAWRTGKGFSGRQSELLRSWNWTGARSLVTGGFWCTHFPAPYHRFPDGTGELSHDHLASTLQLQGGYCQG